MHPRVHHLCAALAATLLLAGTAAADGPRVRTGQLRAVASDPYRAVAAPAGPANVVSTVQEGRGNAGSVVQLGSGNTAGLRQFGRTNTGAITQAGSGNTACLIQAGRNLEGSIEQVGDNQSTGLVQTRWGSSEIPAEVCATATTREDVMAFVTSQPEFNPRGRPRGRFRGEP